VFGLQAAPVAPAPKGPPEEEPDGGVGMGGPLHPSEEAGAAGGVELYVFLSAPDQDIARVHARVELVGAAAGARPSGAEANRLATEAVETLLEPLRGLGGEASAAEVKVEVRCAPSRR
jgi:hypothetical protein